MMPLYRFFLARLSRKSGAAFALWLAVTPWIFKEDMRPAAVATGFFAIFPIYILLRPITNSEILLSHSARSLNTARLLAGLSIILPLALLMILSTALSQNAQATSLIAASLFCSIGLFTALIGVQAALCARCLSWLDFLALGIVVGLAVPLSEEVSGPILFILIGIILALIGVTGLVFLSGDLHELTTGPQSPGKHAPETRVPFFRLTSTRPALLDRCPAKLRYCLRQNNAGNSLLLLAFFITWPILFDTSASPLFLFCVFVPQIFSWPVFYRHLRHQVHPLSARWALSILIMPISIAILITGTSQFHYNAIFGDQELQNLLNKEQHYTYGDKPANGIPDWAERFETHYGIELDASCFSWDNDENTAHIRFTEEANRRFFPARIHANLLDTLALFIGLFLILAIFTATARLQHWRHLPKAQITALILLSLAILACILDWQGLHHALSQKLNPPPTADLSSGGIGLAGGGGVYAFAAPTHSILEILKKYALKNPLAAYATLLPLLLFLIQHCWRSIPHIDLRPQTSSTP